MKHEPPLLGNRKPTFSLRLRLKVTAAVTLVVMALSVIVTWQGASAQTPPATAPAVAVPVLAEKGKPTTPVPSYFYGVLVNTDKDGNPLKDADGKMIPFDPAKDDYDHTMPIPDPTGATYGVWATPSSTFDKEKVGDASNVGDNPASMTPADVYARVMHNQYALNMVWVLIEGFLVMFMQFGFAMVETGLCRAKNASHTYAMNMMVYPLGCLAFYVYGFAIGWGNWFNGPAGAGWYPSLGPGLAILNHPLYAFTTVGTDGTNHLWTILGGKGWCLSGCNDVAVMTLFFFEMVFMDTTATIPTGTMAERWRWGNFCLYGLVIALPYCIIACWVWGGGWLAALGSNLGWGNGAVDFAGSGVVHLMGGIVALAGGIAVGPRIGKYVNGKAQAIPGHDLPMVMGGTFVLAFGWFGFNPGSTLAGTDLRISFVVVNTMLSGIVAALAAMVVMWIKFKKPDPSMMCNGMLAGLVAITAPCAFVSSLSACVIGLIAGVVVVYSVFFWDKMGVDDCVGAISVHGVCGMFGVLAVGLFANGEYGGGYNGVTAHGVTGLFYGGGWAQLGCQALEVLAVLVVGFGIMFPFFKISNLFLPVRVSKEVEMEGLDMPEMGALGYPDFELKTTPSVSGVVMGSSKF